MKNYLVALSLTLNLTTLAACPAFLITHNKTDVESNAFVNDVPSVYPTKANSDNKVAWNLVKFVCYGNIVDNKCTADIKMATETDTPINIGRVSMDLKTGEISPKRLSAHGYTVTVNALGETTITKD